MKNENDSKKIKINHGIKVSDLLKNITYSNQYATWDDAINLIPSLYGNDEAENLFNIFNTNLTPFSVDQSLCNEFTFMLSLNFTLHFVDVYYDGAVSPNFVPEDFVGTTGAVEGIGAEKVSIKYSKSGFQTILQSDMSQTTFGQFFNIVVSIMRKKYQLSNGIPFISY